MSEINRDREQWINEVMISLDQMDQALPKKSLFDNIQADIKRTNASIITMKQWTMVAAAAVILLISNAYILNQYSDELMQPDDNNIGVFDEVVYDYNLYNE